VGWDHDQIAPLGEDIVRCVACGLCLPHCPTFRVTGLETASPRGRIAAMRAVDEGRAEVDSVFATMMDECLACRACEAACPSGVPFGRMIEAARAQIEPHRPARARGVKRLGLTWLLPRRRLIRAMALGLGIAQKLELDRLVPAGLRSSTPRVSLGELLVPLPAAQGPRDGPVAALLTGCVMDAAFRPVHRATLRTLAAAGHRAVVPRGGGCCGALAMHYGHPEAARRMARERIAELEGAELVVVNSAGCSAHMKAYGELLEDDPRFHERAERLAGRVRDLVEMDLGPAASTLPAGRVAVHDACHHLHAQRIGASLRSLLAATGAELVEVADAGRCCGAAGLYSVTQPELSAELRGQKARAIAASGAPVVAVANPGCALQIEAGLRELGSPVRVVHPAELLAAAWGEGRGGAGRAQWQEPEPESLKDPPATGSKRQS
jgi:glycolate oxidase iron-sulfur subunit